jgi:N-terminal half of MaoC dehydratase
MTDSYISDEMRAAIGRQMSRRVSYPISESDIRRWAVAVYYPEKPPARFYDADVAAKSRWGGIVAPEDFNPFAWMVVEEEQAQGGADLGDNNPNRTELSMGVPSPGLKFMLNGGLEMEYGVPMRPGDVITSVSRLGGYTERPGRLGLMVFTVFEDTWTNDRNETVKVSRSTLIRY